MDLFSIAAKIRLDSSDFENGIRKADSSGKGLANSLSDKFNRIESLAKKIATGYAFKKLADAMIKPAVKAYANYEQLVGGVQTLFKEANVFVQQNAAKAYQTAGISANKYMEISTSFAASLISGLKGDTVTAAKYADMAIIDMSDNANKMGTDIESIQNAYRGFSKQNFTMLDNLKLGYGGTKTEMERLLKDAEKLTNKKYDVSNFGDIVEAVHAIQVQMDIAGTTANEAATTISGSWNATKAAWQDLMVAMADPKGNVTKATSKFIEMGKTTLKNVLPIVKQSISGIGQFITEIAPMIGKELPALITEFVPQFLKAGKDLAVGLGKGLWSAAKKIKLPTGKQISKWVNTAKIEIADLLGIKAEDATWLGIAKTAIGKLRIGLKSFGKTAKVNIAELLGIVGSDGKTIADPEKISWGEIGHQVVKKMTGAVSKGGDFLKQLILGDEYKQGESDWAQVGKEISGWVGEAFQKGGLIDKLLQNGGEKIGAIAEFAANFISQLAQWISNNSEKFTAIVENIAGALVKAAGPITEALVSIINNPKIQSAFLDIGASLAQMIWTVFNNGPDGLKLLMGGYAAKKGFDLVSGAKGLFGSAAANASGGGIGSLISTIAGKVGSIASALGPIGGGVAAIAVAAAVLTEEENRKTREKWKNDQEMRAAAAEAMENKENAAFVAQAADALGLAKDENGNYAKNILGQEYHQFSGAIPDLLMGLSSRKNQQLAELALALQGKSAAGNDAFQMLRRVWAGEQFDMVELDELLGVVTDSMVEHDNAMKQRKLNQLQKQARENGDFGPDAMHSIQEAGASVANSFAETSGAAQEAGIQIKAVKQAADDASGNYPIVFDVSTNGDMPSGDYDFDAFHQAKGDWSVPYDNYPSLLHRNEMVLTASQARQYREGGGNANTSALLSAIQGMRNDLQNLKFQVNGKDFGRAVVDYGSGGVRKRNNSVNQAVQAGYGV